MNNSEHTYHIPVLGLGFSVDMPLKTAQYGLSSVMSIVNDNLIEKCASFIQIWHLPYEPILTSHDDARALHDYRISQHDTNYSNKAN